MVHPFPNMKAYCNALILDGDKWQPNKAILTTNKIIMDIVAEEAIPSQAEKIDLKGNFLAPAFIDLQIYGGNGRLFSHELSIESLHATYQYCLSGGVTQFLITLPTISRENILKGIEVVKTYWQEGGKGLLGLHLEGPFINAKKRGAHVAAYIKKPSLEDVALLLKPGRDVIKMITLAPEQCDDAVIKVLQDNKVVVSAGHSDATYEQATAKFNKRILVATHLFNAMSPLQHRAPGLVGAILDHPQVMSSIVPDGIHVDFATLRISKKTMQERLFLITDATTETPEGEYQHIFTTDKYNLPNGTLSGSALTMMTGVKNCVQHAQIELKEAIRMASLYPAQVMGLSNRYGKIKKGYRPEFVAFDKDFKVIEVFPES